MKFKSLLIGLILSSTLFSACQPVDTTMKKTDETTNNQVSSSTYINGYGENAYKELSDFTSAFPKREAGSDNESAAAVYLHDRLEDFGYSPEIESFDFKTDWSGPMNSQNLIARFNPEKKQRILIGAHYDSMPSSDGADDNASGVAALLIIAKQIKSLTLDYGVDFVLFGSEEVGLKGSEAYFEKHKPQLDLMINMDSLIAGDTLYVYGESEKSNVLKKALSMASSKKLHFQTQNEKASGLPYGMTLDASDHAVFKNAGIPILYFEATNWTLGEHDGYTQTSNPEVKGGEVWHTSQDNLKFIESVFPNRPKAHLSAVIDLIVTLLQTDSWR